MSALGLSMAMKDDAKSIAFVEDTAVAPEKLRDFIERFLQIVRSHGTTAGIYAHASVGCLHVRPVINMKTEQGVRTFEAIAGEVSDLVLEFGGALSAEHGDGLVRSPFMQKMFGAVLYQAFREVKRTFDPLGIFNPGKIVDAPPLTANLRLGPGYQTTNPATTREASVPVFIGAVQEDETCVGFLEDLELGTILRVRAGDAIPGQGVTVRAVSLDLLTLVNPASQRVSEIAVGQNLRGVTVVAPPGPSDVPATAPSPTTAPATDAPAPPGPPVPGSGLPPGPPPPAE